MLVRLKVELMRRRISQRELARAIDISDTHLSRLILGQSRCRARLRRKICSFLGVSEREVFPARRARKRKSENAGVA